MKAKPYHRAVTSTPIENDMRQRKLLGYRGRVSWQVPGGSSPSAFHPLGGISPCLLLILAERGARPGGSGWPTALPSFRVLRYTTDHGYGRVTCRRMNRLGALLTVSRTLSCEAVLVTAVPLVHVWRSLEN